MKESKEVHYYCIRVMYQFLVDNLLKLFFLETMPRNLVVQFMLEIHKLLPVLEKSSHLWNMKVMMVEL